MTPVDPPLLNTFNLSEPLSVALKAMRRDTAAEIATLSGGEHLRFEDKRDLEEKLGILANHIPNRYTLSFRPSAQTPGFHEIRTSVVNHPEVAEVAARTTYWAATLPDAK